MSPDVMFVSRQAHPFDNYIEFGFSKESILVNFLFFYLSLCLLELLHLLLSVIPSI